MERQGLMGTLLRVDLTTGRMTEESAEPYRDWVGGIGAASKILYDEVKPGTDAFDPENRLIIACGALSGTPCPGTGRIAAVTKSPVTGGIVSGNSGGGFAPAMRYAGYDYLVFEGAAATPVYLYIKGGRAELRDASFIAGCDVKTANDRLEAVHGRTISTMCIGPAGENRVRFGCITVDRYRVIGKCGFGAVMGSKRLKAIVADGSVGQIPVRDAGAFLAEIDKLYRAIETAPGLQNFLKIGTLCCTPGKYRVGGFSYRHGQDLNISEDMLNKFEGYGLCDKYRVRMTSCAGCMMGCQNRHRITEGPYAGLEMEGTPFNSIFNFGTKLDIDDYAFCIEATWLCNNLGMDMDSVAEILGWVMECTEKGLMTSEELDGLTMAFGRQDTALELIRKIAYRDGAGDVLAEGAARAALVFRPETDYYASYVKKNELFELVRPLVGYGLGALTSTRGGSHVLGSPVCEAGLFNDEERKLAFSKFGVTTFNDPQAYEGKPEIVYYYESLTRACSSVGLCLMACDWQEIHLLDLDGIAALLNAVDGRGVTGKDLQYRMMALLNLEKVFNYAHAGFTRRDDMPRERLFREAVLSGPARGLTLDRDKWNRMMDHYYDLHGWDRESGLPTAETLTYYGLASAIDQIQTG